MNSSPSVPRPSPPRKTTNPPFRWGVLPLGILAVSAASVLIRLAAAPALVVGAWRLLLASLLLTPWGVRRARREWPALTRRDVVLLCLSGVALALHFGTWIASLDYTSVASSVVLVSTNPIFVALASHYFLKERVGPLTVTAIILTLLGCAIVSYGDVSLSGEALLGDALALVGALACSAYILLGRAMRRKLSTLAYVWPCYGLAALVLLLLCALTRQRLGGYDGQTYLIFLLLAVGPQILGHSAFNWALAHFSAILVTLAILGEPVGATLLAWLVLGEAPSLPSLIGGPLILAGILLASREEMVSAKGFAIQGNLGTEEKRPDDRQLE